jgi:hypothetical protein
LENTIPLTPGFSRVARRWPEEKPFETVFLSAASSATALKRGVNEKISMEKHEFKFIRGDSRNSRPAVPFESVFIRVYPWLKFKPFDV